MCLAVPGQIQRLYDHDGVLMGDVCFGSVSREVCLVYTPDLEPGHWVIVHAGFAIHQLDEAAAMQTLSTFRQLEAEAETASAAVDSVSASDVSPSDAER